MVKFLKRHPMLPLIIPAALLIYFVYVALGWNLWVSGSDWEQYSLEASYGFGGFQWYIHMFQDPDFWVALKNTLLLFLIIPICLVLGLLLALLMDQGLKGTSLFRNLILLPFALSYVVTGTVWAWMYNPSSGIINSILPLRWVSMRCRQLDRLAGDGHRLDQSKTRCTITATASTWNPSAPDAPLHREEILHGFHLPFGT